MLQVDKHACIFDIKLRQAELDHQIELIYVCFERGQGHGVATGDKCRRFGKEMSQICIVTKSFVADL